MAYHPFIDTVADAYARGENIDFPEEGTERWYTFYGKDPNQDGKVQITNSRGETYSVPSDNIISTENGDIFVQNGSNETIYYTLDDQYNIAIKKLLT